MGETGIEYVDRSLNPVRARLTVKPPAMTARGVGHYCQKVSRGCTHCYSNGAPGGHRVKVASVASARREFQWEIQRLSMSLPDEARTCLDAMLRSLHALAMANAAESMRRSKYVMFAYWRVVAVYARHFRRYLRSMP